MNPFCLEVAGDYACFTRPEMKVERVSYDIITPSAARAVFESIFWKPGLRWRVRRIEVLAPVRWISVRRNEVGKVTSGSGSSLYIEDERQQRAGLFLRDVKYRLHAEMELVSAEARSNPAKYSAMFTRRAQNGQCVNQPYLGCREFAARFRLINLRNDGAGRFQAPDDEPSALQAWSADLGWMLYDLDFSNLSDPSPQFFRARIERGVMDLSGVETRR